LKSSFNTFKVSPTKTSPSF